MQDQLTPIRVIAFPGAPNLPTFAAQENGFFRDEGVEITLEFTTSSIEQATRTAAGEFDMICTAFDNVVAYGEGQGAAGAGVDPGYVVVAGATQLELCLVSAADVTSFDDLRGKSIALDAVATGFAFVLYDMLERHGISRDEVTMVEVGATPQRWQAVKAGEHAATLTIEPFTSIAQKLGYNILARSSAMYDSYQGGIIAARGEYMGAAPDQVAAFLRGYRRGLAWVCDPANRSQAEAILLERMPQIQPQALGPVMASLLSPKSGLTPNAEILPEGMSTVLRLRSKYANTGRDLTDTQRFLDRSVLDANKMTG